MAKVIEQHLMQITVELGDDGYVQCWLGIIVIPFILNNYCPACTDHI